ncbi:MAG: energy transducer TonB, partial [Bacteroidota bacterium]|nr:energy transducer TonB [Bacteroidota bacterium]
PPPRPPIPVEAPDATDIMPDFDSEPDFNDSTPPPPPLPDRDEADASAEDLIFEAVETYPTIIGGTEALTKALTYPPIAKRAGIEGTVVVRVLLDKNGRVEKTEILKSIGGGCDEAAVDAIRSLRFTPGLQREKPVRVYISIPVHFRLQ